MYASVLHRSLAFIGLHCPHLEHFRAQRCSQGYLTDSGIQHLAQGCPRLKSVDLSGCAQLTGVAVAALAEYCPQLVHLSVVSGAFVLTLTVLLIRLR